MAKSKLAGWFKEKTRNKKSDINNAQSYRDEEGNIVKNFGDQEHIQMVDSTAIDDMHYDKRTGDCSIKFRGNDKEYVYPNVPEEVAKGMKGAPSKGRYFNQNIKPYSENA